MCSSYFDTVESMFPARLRQFLTLQTDASPAVRNLLFFARSARLWLVALALVALVSSGMGQKTPPMEGVSGGVPTKMTESADALRSRVGAAGSVIGFSGCNSSGTQTITLVNTEKFWMAVYHVTADGEIRLVSSRPIDADFSVQLNVTDPLPDDIRGLGQ